MGNGRVFEQALADFRAFYAEHKEDHTAPYPGILELLDELREAGVNLRRTFQQVRRGNGPTCRALLWRPRGPSAGTYRRLSAQALTRQSPRTSSNSLTQIRRPPCTWENSNVDIARLHNAGMRSCGVAWGFRGRAELEGAGADYVIDTSEELLDIVL